MQREHVLVGSAVAVVVVVGLVAVLAPGVLADTDEPVREDHLTLREAPITPANVTEDSATLTVTNWLEHRGGPSENVSLLVRVVDTDTGTVETTARRSVGTISRGGDRAVPVNVTVERSGGYRIETLVFVDGERVTSGSSTVSGVQALRPDRDRTGLRFHSFDGSLPTITYHIADVDGGTATLNATSYLTNGGDGVAEDLELHVRARHAGSNAIADQAVVSVSDVRPGRTTMPHVSLDIPDNYSYQLDAILMRDGDIVDTETAVANLDPDDPATTNESTETDTFDADQFADNDGQDRMPTTESRDPGSGSGNGPGFGVTVALGAIVGAALLLTRRTHD